MEKKQLTKGKIAIIVVACILLPCLLCFTIVTTIASTNRMENLDFVDSYERVTFVNQNSPVFDNDYWTFVAETPIKILQISDIQLGGGWLTKDLDKKALNAIAAMVTAEAPDLVIITGDTSNCDPGRGGSLNNLENLRMVCRLFEKLEVYYTFTFGNQDADKQCTFTRDYIADFLMSSQFYYCIFEKGPEDISGISNQIIKIKDTNGIVTQAIICLDSNTYVDNKISTAINAQKTGKFGGVKQDQVDWLKKEIKAIDEANKEKDPGCEILNTILFMHIPPYEMQEAYNEYKNNNFLDTENVKYLGGEVKETNDALNCSSEDSDFFETLLEIGSTSAIYFGNASLNSIGLQYKGIKMEYSYAIDYFSKDNIQKYGTHRGCKVIYINPDKTTYSINENYYQDKYESKIEKEEVILDKNFGE